MEVMKNTKFQLNISKIIPARTKNIGTQGVNITAINYKLPILEHIVIIS